jgi:hypothetical protein
MLQELPRVSRLRPAICGIGKYVAVAGMLSTLWCISGQSAFAASVLSLTPYDVVLPSLNGDPSPSERVSGQLFYDVSVNAFKGVDNAGSVQSFVTTDAAERVTRARITGSTDFTNCSSTPCTVISQSGSWVTSVSRASAGNYTITIGDGLFSSPPSCTLNGFVHGTKSFVASHGEITTPTSIPVLCHDGTGSNPADCWFDIICIGPR